MKRLSFFISIALLVANINLRAQDFHLSQYDMATQYLNPALTGMYCGEKGDYRIYNDYRSQWSALTKPFSTIYLGYDMPLKKWDKKFGAGAYLIDNRGPAGTFNTLSFMASIAYNITHNSSDKHYLTTGLQLGLFYKNFDPNNFTFDNQYSASEGGFDQSIPSNESFPHTSLLRFDANYGIFYKYVDAEKKVHPYVGITVQHLTMPNESFTSVKDQIPMKFNFQVGCDLIVSDKLKLDPRFLYMYQVHANEINGGLLAFYKIGATGFEAMLGGDYRSEDAIVVHIGIKAGQDIFRFSYDINNSYLNAFTGGRGAWEFSLILTGVKGQPLFSKSMFN